MPRLRTTVLALVLTVAPTLTRAQTQQGAAMPVAEYKDPGTATLLGVLVTGGGQMYSGETSRGLTLLAIGGGSLIAGEVLSVSSCTTVSGSCSLAPIAVGTLVYLGTWAYGLMDAGDAARRHNMSGGVKEARVIPTVERLHGDGGDVTGVGFKLRF
ncbi:hypothetical protein BH09GEM1_BH09GEM1_47450 [soil metagenome]